MVNAESGGGGGPPRASPTSDYATSPAAWLPPPPPPGDGGSDGWGRGGSGSSSGWAPGGPFIPAPSSAASGGWGEAGADMFAFPTGGALPMPRGQQQQHGLLQQRRPPVSVAWDVRPPSPSDWVRGIGQGQEYNERVGRDLIQQRQKGSSGAALPSGRGGGGGSESGAGGPRKYGKGWVGDFGHLQSEPRCGE